MNDSEHVRHQFQVLGEEAMAALDKIHAAREMGLAASRKAVQLSSRAIRAAHRGEFETARELSIEAGAVIAGATRDLQDAPSVRHAGFMLDGQKEYVESAITIAFISGTDVPTPSDLDVDFPAYLNGLAEAASELRRSALDAIRHGNVARADELLGLMDETMGLLAIVDFPEGVTSGLRRTTDQLRAVTERTRGDVTAALRQAALEHRISALESRLPGNLEH